jgi:hypothetical protein
MSNGHKIVYLKPKHITKDRFTYIEQKEWIFVDDNQFIKMIQKYWNILNGGIYYEKAIKIINELQKI